MARNVRTKKATRSEATTRTNDITMAKPARKPQKNPNCFTLFPKLPPELRLMVWGFAANALRTVDMQSPSYAHPALSTTLPQPSILKVNVEARREALKHYSVLSTPSGAPLVKAPFLYFNFIADTIPLSISVKDGNPRYASATKAAIHPAWLFDLADRGDLAKVQCYIIPEPEPTNRVGSKVLRYGCHFVRGFACLYFTSTRIAELSFTQKRTRRSNSTTQLEVFTTMLQFYTIISYRGKNDLSYRPIEETKILVQGLEEEGVKKGIEYQRETLFGAS